MLCFVPEPPHQPEDSSNGAVVGGVVVLVFVLIAAAAVVGVCIAKRYRKEGRVNSVYDVQYI